MLSGGKDDGKEQILRTITLKLKVTITFIKISLTHSLATTHLQQENW